LASISSGRRLSTSCSEFTSEHTEFLGRNPYRGVQQSSGLVLVSADAHVTVLRFLRCDEEVQLENLSTPLRISVHVLSPQTVLPDFQYTLACAMYDEVGNVWSTQGLAVEDAASDPMSTTMTNCLASEGGGAYTAVWMSERLSTTTTTTTAASTAAMSSIVTTTTATVASTTLAIATSSIVITTTATAASTTLATVTQSCQLTQISQFDADLPRDLTAWSCSPPGNNEVPHGAFCLGVCTTGPQAEVECRNGLLHAVRKCENSTTGGGPSTSREIIIIRAKEEEKVEKGGMAVSVIVGIVVAVVLLCGGGLLAMMCCRKRPTREEGRAAMYSHSRSGLAVHPEPEVVMHPEPEAPPEAELRQAADGSSDPVRQHSGDQEEALGAPPESSNLDHRAPEEVAPEEQNVAINVRQADAVEAPPHWVAWVSLDPHTAQIEPYPGPVARVLEGGHRIGAEEVELGEQFFGATVHFRGGSRGGPFQRTSQGLQDVRRVPMRRADETVSVFVTGLPGDFRICESHDEGAEEHTLVVKKEDALRAAGEFSVDVS